MKRGAKNPPFWEDSGASWNAEHPQLEICSCMSEDCNLIASPEDLQWDGMKFSEFAPRAYVLDLVSRVLDLDHDLER